MGAFKYEGFSKDGKKIAGEIEGQSLAEVKKLLRRDGIRATKLKEPSIFDTDFNQLIAEKIGSGGFAEKDLNRFTKQLAILIDAGVPILQCLEMLHKQEKVFGLKKAILNVARNVGGGKNLHEAMGLEKGFPRLYCQLVKAGGESGQLDAFLNKLALFMDRKDKIRKKIKSAMTYPTIVVCVGIGVVVGLLTFVVPQFVDMIKDSGQEIPWITAMVMDLSAFFASNVTMILLGLLTTAGSIIYTLKTPKGKEFFDTFIMKTPIFGNIIIKGNLSSFSQTLGTLLSSGIPIVDALDICSETIDNIVIARDIKKVRLAVISGKTMTDPLKRIKYFPELVAQMIEVGENTGNTDQMLEKVANVFEIEVENSIQAMTQMIEPLILVGLGGVIGVVLIAMYLPVFMSAGGAG